MVQRAFEGFTDMKTPMLYSSAGLHLTEQFEGCKLIAYQDVKGVWTIGYGHTAGVREGDTCSQIQAEIWLQQDISWAATVVNRYVTVNLDQGQFDALVDFVFNAGSGNFSESTMLKLINAGHLDQAAAEFEKWDKAGGLVVAGLLRRRKAEEGEFES